MFSRLKSAFNPGSAEDPEAGGSGIDGIASDLQDASNTSWDLRIMKFTLCFALSLICSFLGSPLLISGKFTGFGVMVSLGAVLSLISTCFLSGPRKQFRSMFAPTRLIATTVYIVFIVMTFIAGLVLKNSALAIICIGGQYVAMAWYSLSYVPYARETVLRIFGNCF
ncbi:hypothetical protein FO519_005376 [Halicephalobus sp. NKZ332]|nr:hypothetical protein FO519_005376 [Halicephalobus sp. NKZ332]